jgi:hypothetical protein
LGSVQIFFVILIERLNWLGLILHPFAEGSCQQIPKNWGCLLFKGSDAALVQCYGPLNAGSGSRRARSNSIPARPYICRFSILSRLSCPSTGPLLHGSLTAASTALRSCFKVRTKRTSEWILVLRASSIQRWRVVTLPLRRIARKLRTSLRMTAKPGHCRFRVSTICTCWLVNSARTLLNSAAATCGDSCLDPVEVVASSCDASGNAEFGLRVSAFGWRHGERNFARPE